MEENLRRDIVRVVSDYAKLLTVRINRSQIKAKKIRVEYTSGQFRIVVAQIVDALAVYFSHFHIMARRDEIFCQYAHSGAYLHHRKTLV